jgi:hypothetical protein
MSRAWLRIAAILVSYFIDCDTHDVYSTIYYGRCNPGDTWTQLSGPDDCPNWC